MAARPTVDEVSAPYANFMRTPTPAGPDICSVCRTFTDGYPTCYRCAHQPDHLDVVVPITYAPSTEQMHTALRKYKDSPPMRRYALGSRETSSLSSGGSSAGMSAASSSRQASLHSTS